MGFVTCHYLGRGRSSLYIRTLYFSLIVSPFSTNQRHHSSFFPTQTMQMTPPSRSQLIPFPFLATHQHAIISQSSNTRLFLNTIHTKITLELISQSKYCIIKSIFTTPASSTPHKSRPTPCANHENQHLTRTTLTLPRRNHPFSINLLQSH